MKRKLIINLEETEDDDEVIVSRVLELLSEGYTSGFDPSWHIEEKYNGDESPL